MSKQCRYNSSTKRYYSVAEHCWLVAEILIQTPDDARRLVLGPPARRGGSLDWRHHGPIKNCLGAAYKGDRVARGQEVARRWMPGRKPVDTPFFHHVDKQVAFSTELRDVVKPSAGPSMRLLIPN